MAEVVSSVDPATVLVGEPVAAVAGCGTAAEVVAAIQDAAGTPTRVV